MRPPGAGAALPVRSAPLVLIALAALAALPALSGCGACRDQPAALAELVQAEGPVERAAAGETAAGGGDAWRPASLGARFYLGDSARTGTGAAQLQLAGSSRLDMTPHTVLRFGRRGDKATEQRLAVELGTIEIAGGGAFQFDVGEISVEQNGGVRISAGKAGSRVELLVGRASIRPTGGELTPLAPGVAVDFSDIEIRSVPDATRGDAGPVAAPDAAAAPDAPGADAAAAAAVAVETTGTTEVRAAADQPWQPLPGGARTVELGTQLRVKSGTARLDTGDVAVALEKGGVVAVTPERRLAVLDGDALVRAAPGKAASVALPGGELAFEATPRGAAGDVAVGSRESRVRVTGGKLALVGAKGSRLEMRRGESALLGKAGAIRVLVAVPEAFDVAIAAGESVTVHDARGAAAVQFRFAEQCPEGGVVELDSSASFRTPAVSAGEGAANLMVSSGSYHYRVRCEERGGDGRPVASGRLYVVRDSGRRPLPAAPPPFQLDADGRTYRVGYQAAIPTMKVVWKGGSGDSFTLRLARDGKDQSFSSSEPSYSIPGSKLSEGVYMLWFEKSGGRSKVSTLIIDFDNTAPAVYIDEPDDGEAWAAEVTIKGAVLPGWTVGIDGVALPLDKQRRFRATVPAPPSTLAIRVSHPQRGVHYYLRRRR
jgi:hypothetical protein